MSRGKAIWASYYQHTANDPPRPTLLRVLKLFAAEAERPLPLQAIDLGCGTGIDTLELLRHGWQVLAIDQQEEAMARVWAAAPPEHQPRLQRQQAAFIDARLPSADLIYAGYALPFCRPGDFPAAWAKVVAAVAENGRFAGQFFGPKDTWASTAPEVMTFHSLEAVQMLLRPFTIEWLEEEDADGPTAVGETKHWHIFHVIARRAPQAMVKIGSIFEIEPI